MTLNSQSSGPIQSSLDGKFRWDQGQGKLNTNTTAIAVTPSEEGGDPGDIMKAIDALTELGGTVYLRNGTYLLEEDIVVPSLVTLQGESGAGVILDFQNAAFQIIAEGENAYSTGTVAVNNGSDAVTGTGTTWDTGMIGQSIIISGIFFVIIDVASTTSLTLESPFDSPDVTGAEYVICDPISGVTLNNLTVQNSIHADGAILYKNMNGGNMEGIAVITSHIGLNFLDCSAVLCEDVGAIACGVGINVDHGGVWTFTDFYAYASTTDNIVFNRFISASVSNSTISSAGGNGITITNSSNLGVYDMTITTNGAKGIEVSDSSYIQISGMVIEDNVSDGLKLTSNADNCTVVGVAAINNGAYGINIANANCNNNILSSSTFSNNASGTYSNSGTDTILLLTSGGGGGGTVDTVVAGNNIDVDATDPANPIVAVETLTLADISDITSTATEVNYTDGVTSAIQTQLDAKLAKASNLSDVANAATAFGNIKQAASDTATGVVELATTAETTTGTDATRAVTPDGLHDMTSLAGAAWFLDEDDFASNSDTKVPSQQSSKAYIDAQIIASGSGDVVGPASVTDDNPAVFDGTTGKLIKQKTYAAFKTLLALVKGDVGLGNVDNTSDATKNAASATLTNKTVSKASNTIVNPYKFLAYKSDAQNTSTGAFVKVTFATEVFDSNSNFATSTYTVPVAGFYCFYGRVDFTAAEGIIAIYKNGSELYRGGDSRVTAARMGLVVSIMDQFAANDTIEIWVFDNSASAITTGQSVTYFGGYLMSHS